MKLSPAAAHWGSAVLAALIILMAINPMLSTGAKKKYGYTNSLKGKALFKATNVKPGALGGGSVIIKNTGAKPIRFNLTQDQVANSGIGKALVLRIYDKSAKRCLYPKRKGACIRWAPWAGGAKLRKLPLLSLKGKKTWKKREKHEIQVQWQLGATSTNSDQGKTAQFRLLWTARQ